MLGGHFSEKALHFTIKRFSQVIFEKISVRLLVAHLLVVFIKENIENSESFSHVNFDAEMQIFAGIKTGNDV